MTIIRQVWDITGLRPLNSETARRLLSNRSRIDVPISHSLLEGQHQTGQGNEANATLSGLAAHLCGELQVEVRDKDGHGRGHIHACQLLPQAVPDTAAEGVVAPRLRMHCPDLRDLSLRRVLSCSRLSTRQTSKLRSCMHQLHHYTLSTLPLGTR